MKNNLLICLIFILFIVGQNCFLLNQTSLKNLNPTKPDYNVTVSKDYAILAITSYCDKKCIENWSCEVTKNYLKDDKVINVTHVMGTLTRASGFVAFDSTKNLIVVSLRGSANAENWVSDFSFDTVAYSKCKDCKVHVGFLEDFNSIQKKMNEAIDVLVKAYPTASILTAGHSMGAALSVIVGIEIKLKYNKVVEIQNIGCPRVGNSNFAQFVQTKVDRINRIVHNRDLVVHLPPEQFGYHHEAHQIFFDKPMQSFVICNQSGEDKNCSNKFFPEFDAADHSFYFWDLGKILKC